MRSSNSKEHQTYSQTQNQRNQQTNPRKTPRTPNTPGDASMKVAPSSGKGDRRQLPPRPVSKVSYDLEVNMTQSKIFKAKQGLQLLKKKMTRTGMSRQKSYSNTEKIDENNNEHLIVKKMNNQQQPKTEKEISFKKTKQPTFHQRQTHTSQTVEVRAKKEPLKNKQMNQYGHEEIVDQRPISNEVDFMELLDREMRKQNQISVKGGAKIQRERNKIYNQNGEEIILHECTMGCGRMFNPDAIEKHQKNCQKIFQSKRKAFDSSSKRQIQGSATTYHKPMSKIEEKPKPKSEVPKWKIESARLRVGLKLAKNEAISKEEEKIMKTEQDTLKPCQYCGRKFNEKAAEKHIPFCQRKSKELSKNPFGRKR